MSPVNLDPWTDIVNVAWGGFVVVVDATIPDAQSFIPSNPPASFFLENASPGDVLHKADWKKYDVSKFDFDDFSQGAVPLFAYGADSGGHELFNRRLTWLFNLTQPERAFHGTYFDASGTARPLPPGQMPFTVNPAAGTGFLISPQPTVLRIRGFGAGHDFKVVADYEVEPADPVSPAFDVTDTTISDGIGGQITVWLIGKTGFAGRTDHHT